MSYTCANQLRMALSLQRPSASPLSQGYSYDLAKRLTTIANAVGNYVYQYDPTYQLHVSMLTFPNGAYVSNSFGPMGEMTGTFLKNSSHSVLNSHEYTYNASDYREVTRQTRTDGSYVDYGYKQVSVLTIDTGEVGSWFASKNSCCALRLNTVNKISNRQRPAKRWKTCRA